MFDWLVYIICRAYKIPKDKTWYLSSRTEIARLRLNTILILFNATAFLYVTVIILLESHPYIYLFSSSTVITIFSFTYITFNRLKKIDERYANWHLGMSKARFILGSILITLVLVLNFWFWTH